jgi:hypothetical protein
VGAGLAEVSSRARSVLLCLARAHSRLSIPICSLWLDPVVFFVYFLAAVTFAWELLEVLP